MKPGRGTAAATLCAIVLGAGGLTFGIYVYSIPYTELLADLKRRSGEVMVAQQTSESLRKEIGQLRGDVADATQAARAARAASSQMGGEDLRRRGQIVRIKATLEAGLRVGKDVLGTGAAATMTIDDQHLLVRLSGKAVFDAKGTGLSKAGQAAVTKVGRAALSPGTRVIVLVPTVGPAGNADRRRASKRAEAAQACVRVAVRTLVAAGVKPDMVLGVMAGAVGPAPAGPVLDIEIAP